MLVSEGYLITSNQDAGKNMGGKCMWEYKELSKFNIFYLQLHT